MSGLPLEEAPIGRGLSSGLVKSVSHPFPVALASKTAFVPLALSFESKMDQLA